MNARNRDACFQQRRLLSTDTLVVNRDACCQQTRLLSIDTLVNRDACCQQGRLLSIGTLVVNRDACQLFKTLKILQLKLQRFLPFIICCQKQRHMNRMQKFTTLTLDIVDLQTATANLTTFQKGPFYFGLTFLITFPLASTIHLMTQTNSDLF